MERTERLRGRAGQAQRLRRLERTKGLCEKCLENGRSVPATEVDHITPLAFGGSDEDSNTQNLCADHHADKTVMEAASHQAASNHPDWIKQSAIPLTIVCGPPASGKTTYLEKYASPDDVVIDLDGIMRRLRPEYRHWSGYMDSALFNRAIRVRNEMLGSLSRRTHGRAWFIVSAPTEAERAWWHGKLGGELVLLHPGIEECKRRALERSTPSAVQGIDKWDKASRSPWLPPQVRKAKHMIGADGWPIVDGR